MENCRKFQERDADITHRSLSPSFSHFSPRSSPFVTPIIAPTFVFSQPSKTPPSEIITSFHPSTFHGIHVYLYTRPLLLLLVDGREEERLVAHIYTRGQKYRLGMPREVPNWKACHLVTHTRALPVVLSGSITGGGEASNSQVEWQLIGV